MAFTDPKDLCFNGLVSAELCQSRPHCAAIHIGHVTECRYETFVN